MTWGDGSCSFPSTSLQRRSSLKHKSESALGTCCVIGYPGLVYQMSPQGTSEVTGVHFLIAYKGLAFSRNFFWLILPFP